jgi:crossover junction endodeoxyribonuclease RuvC
MQQSKSEKIILGIDPGTNILGYGIIMAKGSELLLLEMGVMNLKKIRSHELKLKHIFEDALRLIDKHHPDELAIEAPFFGKNVQSMLKLGRAQGVAMAAGLYRSIPIFEYSPRKIKQAITGNGNSSKGQVASMLQHLLVLKSLPKHFDETDAVAVAVCHYFQKGVKKKSSGKTGGWNDFLELNPDRLVTR